MPFRERVTSHGGFSLCYWRDVVYYGSCHYLSRLVEENEVEPHEEVGGCWVVSRTSKSWLVMKMKEIRRIMPLCLGKMAMLVVCI